MAKQKQKYYVVWVGREQGVFTDWETCKAQVEGFEGAKYKSFPTKDEAQNAFMSSPEDYIIRKGKTRETVDSSSVASGIIYPSLSVDAACSGNPGVMEYQGVDTQTGQVIFHRGPFLNATNNIGEFLALVHGLAYMKKNGYSYPIYSDSRTAQSWVRQGKCKTKMPIDTINPEVADLIQRAEKWLHTHSYSTQIIKWDTGQWGEIPADFGRK